MHFSAALTELKNGKRIARHGWNGKNMYLFLIESENWQFTEERPGLFFQAHNKELMMNKDPFIVMKTVNDTLVPWLASQTDILATDWVIRVD